MQVPKKQQKQRRLTLGGSENSCVRKRALRPNHVWSYDFVSARTHDGRSVRILNLIDESTRECLLIRAERRWSSAKVAVAAGRMHKPTQQPCFRHQSFLE